MRFTAALFAGLVFAFPAVAQEKAYIPLIYTVDDLPLKTTACLEVQERVYAAQEFAAAAADVKTPEHVLQGVLSALAAKDTAALKALSHPELADNEAEFTKQAGAYTSQYAMLKNLAVVRSYQVDDAALFLAQYEYNGTAQYVTFKLAQKPDGTYGFIAYRPNQTGLFIVSDWLTSPFGPAKTDAPEYCDAAVVKDATQHLPLAPDYAGTKSILHFAGYKADALQVAPIIERFNSIQAGLAQHNPAFYNGMLTPAHAKAATTWFAAASEDERSKFNGYYYGTSETPLKPQYVIDAGMVQIVYTGNFRPLYLVKLAPAAPALLDNRMLAFNGALSKGAVYEQLPKP